MKKIAQATLFNLRWLTVKYYKKKGFVPLDISHWTPCEIPSIKRMLSSSQPDKKSDALFLKDSKEKPYAIVLIKDWKRVVGVNQCYQVERLRGLLKSENIELGNLKFILISRNGFSESVKRFARKQNIERLSEADMTYGNPHMERLGDIVKQHRIAAKIAEEKAKAKEKEELEETTSEDNLEDIKIPHMKEDEMREDYRKPDNI
ncbi:MAG: hypothetical protein ACFFCD_02450 [Promethearchaeota archaeon]